MVTSFVSNFVTLVVVVYLVIDCSAKPPPKPPCVALTSKYLIVCVCIYILIGTKSSTVK